MSKIVRFGFAAFIVLTLMNGLASARTLIADPPDVTISLTPSVQSPQMLGVSITWTAVVMNGPPHHFYDYQFAVALQGQNQIVRDFSETNAFNWVPYTVEGNYVVTVTVRDITQQPYQVFPPVMQPYELLPWVTNSGGSYVNPTTHPLVALFSAGPCTSGHSIRVRFRPNGSQTSMATNAVPCSQQSANFLVAGMTPSSQYLMHWEEFASNYDNSGPDLPFNTGPLPSNFPPPMRVWRLNVPPSGHDAAFPVNLFEMLAGAGGINTFWPVATDLQGDILWYFPGEVFMTRMQPGGSFFTITNGILSAYDLAGNEILETNTEIVNEQLTAKGYPNITSFNLHETRRLPNGNLLLLGARDIISIQYQGGSPQHPVDILGDMILILDHNMQLVWAWDSFTHEDLNREATLGDLCYHNNGGCPDFSERFTQSNDWLHTNSAQLTADGNILLSQRSQDWVIKVNYNNGQGDGRVLWRMGPFGDFTITNPPQTQCGDPNVYPWFTHQHDAAFQPQVGTFPTMTVFDDGNLRHQQCNGGNSRGMVLYVAEANRTVTIGVQADLGQYSAALGSAQLLVSPPNSPYASFGNGLITLPQHYSQSTEVDLNGNIVYELQGTDWSYRTYRQADLYTPTTP